MATRTRENKKKIKASQVMLNIIFVLICACYILPFMMVITISLSNASNVMSEGFKIFPTEIDFTAYKIVFSDMSDILNAYKVTIIFSVTHTILAVVLQATISYPMSRRSFSGKKILTYYVFATMLFGAGLIPTYIVYTQNYGLGDTIWSYIIPGVVVAWNCMLIKTNYTTIPEEMLEAAKIDGAGEFRTFLTMVVPLSKPVYATIGFLTLVNKWNDWNTALVYIRSSELYSLQYLLQSILRNAEKIKEMADNAMVTDELLANMSTEPTRFAMAIVAAGPMLVVFPWFQKYFARGLTVGAVKG